MKPTKKTQVEILSEKITSSENETDVKNQELSDLIQDVEQELDKYDINGRIEEYLRQSDKYNFISSKWNLGYLKDNIKRLTLLESELKRRTKTSPLYDRIFTYLKTYYDKDYKQVSKYDLNQLIVEYSKQLDKVGIIYSGTLKKAWNTQKEIEMQKDKFTNSLAESRVDLQRLSEQNSTLEQKYQTLENVLAKMSKNDPNYFYIRNLKTKVFTNLYAIKSERRVKQLKIDFYEQQYHILDLASKMLSYIVMNAQAGLNYVLNMNDTVKSLTNAFGDIRDLTKNMGYLNEGLKSLYGGLTTLWNSSFENVKSMGNMTKRDVLSKNFGLNPNLESEIKSLISDSIDFLDDEYLSSLSG
ncbi:MAG: hypothetical protein PWP03_82 [Candidatus Woesearchaeota archaeon]|nr:hypothetical protein [Candidatus Woesearchaeota archaeon]MDN5327444.1 hypothetical protein [Candidatus Woesearchaeota archaeon]